MRDSFCASQFPIKVSLWESRTSSVQLWLKLLLSHLIIKIQLPANIPGFLFTQQQQPQHWNDAIYGPANWPMNVLLMPAIPSANHSQKKYKILILYKPTNIPWVPLGPNHWLGYPGPAGHIHAVCCGPSRDTSCPVGARASPCAHGAAAILAGCVLPTNPVI